MNRRSSHEPDALPVSVEVRSGLVISASRVGAGGFSPSNRLGQPGLVVGSRRGEGPGIRGNDQGGVDAYPTPVHEVG